jgi:formate/nitrite transporter FocA (FNT family)
VYAGNLVGALFVAYTFGYKSGLLKDDPLRSGAMGHAVLKTTLTPAEIFIRGMGCNWLVCLAVWTAAGLIR